MMDYDEPGKKDDDTSSDSGSSDDQGCPATEENKYCQAQAVKFNACLFFTDEYTKTDKEFDAATTMKGFPFSKCTSYMNNFDACCMAACQACESNDNKKYDCQTACGGTPCGSSATCGSGGFCNFDDGASGFCEQCEDIDDCATEGFINKKGNAECSKVCAASTGKQMDESVKKDDDSQEDPFLIFGGIPRIFGDDDA